MRQRAVGVVLGLGIALFAAPASADGPRAPRFSLWGGVRPGLMITAGSFYEYQVAGRHAEFETTGNIVKPGPVLQGDLGVRLFRRFVAYGFYERGFLTQGTLFRGTDATLASEYAGGGGRVIFGNPDRLGFVLDLALGVRTLSASGSTGRWHMRTLELFRFGLGAEIRLTDFFVLSPMFTVSTGAMSTASGDIRYAPGTSVLDRPVYVDGAELAAARTYLIAGLVVGAHFDLLGDVL